MSSRARDEKPPAGFVKVELELLEGVNKDKNEKKPINKQKVK